MFWTRLLEKSSHLTNPIINTNDVGVISQIELCKLKKHHVEEVKIALCVDL